MSRQCGCAITLSRSIAVLGLWRPIEFLGWNAPLLPFKRRERCAMFARLKEKIQSAGSAAESKPESDTEPVASSSGSPKATSPATSRQLSQDDGSHGLGLEAMPRAELEAFAAKRHRQWQRGQEKLSDLVCSRSVSSCWQCS